MTRFGLVSTSSIQFPGSRSVISRFHKEIGIGIWKKDIQKQRRNKVIINCLSSDHHYSKINT